MSGFRSFTLAVTRPGTITFVSGRPVEAASTTFNITASVQSVSGADLETLEEGRRTKRNFTLFSGTELNTTSSGRNPDRISIFGGNYEVVSKHIWKNSVINHYKYIVSEI